MTRIVQLPGSNKDKAIYTQTHLFEDLTCDTQMTREILATLLGNH